MSMENSPLPYSKPKFIAALLFLFLFPPIALYYIWKERSNLLYKFPVLLWISAGYSVVSSVGFLGFLSGLSQIPEVRIQASPLLSALAYIVILFAGAQFVFGFFLDRKITSDHILSARYERIYFICLLFNILIPFAFLILPSLALKDIYQLLLQKEMGI